MLAFIPLQGRPFSQWILAFFKAVYSPTEYFWNPSPPSTVEFQSPTSNLQPPISKSPTPLDNLESQLVAKVSDLFNTVVHRAAPVSRTPEPSPQNLAPHSTSFLTVDQLREIAAGITPPPPPPAATEGQAPPFLTPTVSYTPKPAVAPAMAAAAATMFAPTQPNILAGVVSQGGEIPIEGAILEIAEKATGLPVRALKTNKLGQFQIATPLANGEYVITAEKEGFVIDSVAIVTQGQVMAPIDIRGRGVS